MNYYDRSQPYHCLLKTEKPTITCSMCDRYQCQMCFDYQAGLTRPAYPMLATNTNAAWATAVQQIIKAWL